METKSSKCLSLFPLWLLCFIIITLFSSSSSSIWYDDHISLREINAEESFQFPKNFLFGTASSAYQYEGAYLTDGKTLSNWDVFTSIPGKISDGSHGKVAVDHYHRYPEDLDLMKDLGVNSYRFSLSWARILPKGRFGDVNMGGIDHYNTMINNILKRGIEPFVTLTHYDIPQELEFRYRSWLNPQIREDFEHYAEICFRHFGDRVKFWATFNEPNVQVILGYRTGTYPPSRCSKTLGNCTHGDSDIEPVVAAHNIIRSHLAAVSLYRTKFQEQQRGKIGIVMNTIWFEPVSDSLADKLAAERAQAFYLTWFLDPVVFGRYPREMQEILGEDLPEFTEDDFKSSKNRLDFIGINQYTSRYAKDCLHSACELGKGGSRAEGFVYANALKDGLALGEPTGVNWFTTYPQGMEEMLMYATERYKDIPLYVTENGFGENNTGVLFNDYRRVKFMSNYLDALKRAMRKGADVRGYFAWSLLDNFEWISGYTIRFGMYHVDFNTQERTPRLSASWYKNFIFHHRAQSKDDCCLSFTAASLDKILNIRTCVSSPPRSPSFVEVLSIIIIPRDLTSLKTNSYPRFLPMPINPFSSSGFLFVLLHCVMFLCFPIRVYLRIHHFCYSCWHVHRVTNQRCPISCKLGPDLVSLAC